MNYWLMKSEPSCFSIDDLQNCPKQTSMWDGVRNYQARNMMRDQMQIGDLVFFYHSRCKVPGIVGIAKIVSESYDDPTQFDEKDEHYDPKSKPEKPIWQLVDVQFVEKFSETISLTLLKSFALELGDFHLLQKGNRLSVMPVKQNQWNFILSLKKV